MYNRYIVHTKILETYPEVIKVGLIVNEKLKFTFRNTDLLYPNAVTDIYIGHGERIGD